VSVERARFGSLSEPHGSSRSSNHHLGQREPRVHRAPAVGHHPPLQVELPQCRPSLRVRALQLGPPLPPLLQGLGLGCLLEPEDNHHILLDKNRRDTGESQSRQPEDNHHILLDKNRRDTGESQSRQPTHPTIQPSNTAADEQGGGVPHFGARVVLTVDGARKQQAGVSLGLGYVLPPFALDGVQQRLCAHPRHPIVAAPPALAHQHGIVGPEQTQAGSTDTRSTDTRSTDTRNRAGRVCQLSRASVFILGFC
jgi:hypothetical protein